MYRMEPWIKTLVPALTLLAAQGCTGPAPRPVAGPAGSARGPLLRRGPAATIPELAEHGPFDPERIDHRRHHARRQTSRPPRPHTQIGRQRLRLRLQERRRCAAAADRQPCPLVGAPWSSRDVEGGTELSARLPASRALSLMERVRCHARRGQPAGTLDTCLLEGLPRLDVTALYDGRNVTLRLVASQQETTARLRVRLTGCKGLAVCMNSAPPLSP